MNIIVGASILLASVSHSFGACQQDYANAIEAKDGIPQFVHENYDEIMYTYYIGGSIVGLTATGALVFFTLPLAAYYSARLVDEIKDEKMRNLIKILDHADFITGKKPVPQPNLSASEFYEVHGNRSQVRQIRRLNRDTRRDNMAIVKANDELRDYLSSAEKQFMKLYHKVAMDMPGMSYTEFAQVISQDNEDRNFCNGKIGMTDEDAVVLLPRVEVNGRTRAERREQKRLNRKADRRFNKYVKQMQKHILASRADIIKYYLSLENL